MRRFSGFLAQSGVVWLGGLFGLDALDGGPQTWSTTLASWLMVPLVAHAYLGDRGKFAVALADGTNDVAAATLLL